MRFGRFMRRAETICTNEKKLTAPMVSLERTLDNMRCRVANNREHVSTRLSCTDIIIDSVTEGTVLNVMARFQSVTSRASSFAEKEKGYTPWYAIVFIRLLKFDG